MGILSLHADFQKKWSVRRVELFRERMETAGAADLIAKFFDIPHVSDVTADYLVLEAANVVPLVAYLSDHPDEADRLCYLSPPMQRSELLRLDQEV